MGMRSMPPKSCPFSSTTRRQTILLRTLHTEQFVLKAISNSLLLYSVPSAHCFPPGLCWLRLGQKGA